MFFSCIFELLTKLLLLTGRVESKNAFDKPLTITEEKECFEKMKLGDKLSEEILIKHNLRLVAHIAKKFDSKSSDNDDLISIGTIGLIKGIDSYSLKPGTKITTYCARCIENEILMYFRSNKKNNSNVSLDDPIGFDKEGNEITILDVLKTPTIDYAEEIDKSNNLKLLEKYFSILTTREKEIIIRRYGLNNTDELTQKEIAKELKISRSYVSRIEKRAITKILREFLKHGKK